MANRNRPDIRRDCDKDRMYRNICHSNPIGTDLTFEGIATKHSSHIVSPSTSIGTDLTFEGIATIFLISLLSRYFILPSEQT